MIFIRKRKIIRALLAERQEEADLAMRFATFIDERKPHPADQRRFILAQSEGRINGFDIALGLLGHYGRGRS